MANQHTQKTSVQPPPGKPAIQKSGVMVKLHRLDGSIDMANFVFGEVMPGEYFSMVIHPSVSVEE